MAGLKRQRAGVVCLALAGTVLSAGWVTGIFGAAPPVYDGLPLPSEPYRYLQPPRGLATTGPPGSVTETVTATTGTGTGIEPSTTETPPQASVILTTSSFTVAAGAAVVVRIRAVPPPRPPSSGQFDGNVYQFSASTAGAPVALASGATATIVLRSSGSPGTPVLEAFDGSAWHALPTTAVPPLEYAAPVPDLGDFALVLLPGAAAAARASARGSGLITAVVIGVVLVTVGGLLSLIRRSRRRSA